MKRSALPLPGRRNLCFMEVSFEGILWKTESEALLQKHSDRTFLVCSGLGCLRLSRVGTLTWMDIDCSNTWGHICAASRWVGQSATNHSQW